MGQQRLAVIPRRALQVFAARKITATDLVVLAALGAFANRARECWPSVGTIATEIGMDKRNVKRRLRRLERAGLISRSEQARDNGMQTSNLYKLRVDEPVMGGKGVVKTTTPPWSQLPPPGVVKSTTQTANNGKYNGFRKRHSISTSSKQSIGNRSNPLQPGGLRKVFGGAND